MAVARYYSSNAVDTALSFAIISDSETSFVVDSAQGFPNSFPFTVAISYDSANEELVNVVDATALTNGKTQFTVGLVYGTANVDGRGVDNTTATTHAAGAKVKHVISARDLRELQEHVNATGQYTVPLDVNPTPLHGIGTGEGAVVGTLKSQTLQNKTISGANNTISNIAQSSVTNLTTDLAAKASTSSLTAHTSATTSVHGIADTSVLATNSSVSSAVSSGVSTHAAVTTSVHGIADTSKLLNIVSALAGRTIYVQANEPTSPVNGDIWFDLP